MGSKSWWTAALLAGVFVIGGCDREGPAEQTGEEIDEATGEAREQAEELGEETEE